ncbi:MAG TPA: hypothetical protein VMT26_01565 [Candidatus Bathyarchaeia archaeon]|jgi:hypothetical protein|nr:hypothetical protein [Candidatus Bathyarchaeia archaeon]
MVRKKEFIHDRRAITPVLSTLLLTVVAVSIMALATTATYVISTNLRENMSERLIIEDVWFNPSTGNIHVYLRNIGKISVQVSTVYVNHTSQVFISLKLEIDGHGWLNVSQTWTSNSLYYIDVVTSRGTHVGGYYESP